MRSDNERALQALLFSAATNLEGAAATSGETGKQRVLHSLHLRSDVCMVSIWSGRHLAQITVNLVDPASSHMLVSKIKPCMSQHKRFTARLQMAH